MAATPDNLKITKDSAQVIIGLSRVTENWTKSLTLITPPKTDSEQDIANGKNDTKFVDLLLKAEHRYTFDGYIGDSIVNRSDEGNKDENGNTITDATDILDTMRKIFFAGGVFTINWNGTDYNCNSDKFESRWVANDKDTITSYDVKFTAVVGDDL